MSPLNKHLDILVLEDNPDDVGLLERVLRKEGLQFSLRVADSREEFIGELERAQPDVILSDHTLPAFNSIEAIRIAQDYYADIPFILVTGSVSEEFAVQCMKAGADDYILKGRLTRLPAAIRNIFLSKEVKREKDEIELLHRKLQEAYEEIGEQHRNITDSIHYAKHIQEAMLPTAESFSRVFPGALLIYRPKNIISGDFYWIAEKNGLKYIAVADCTGHGVPGALMSMLGFILLREIINQPDDPAPGEILMTMNKAVRRALRQEEAQSRSHDGMDIGICCIGRNGNWLEFAGANHSLFHFSGGQIRIVKGDKCGVGGAYTSSDRSFTGHTLQYTPGDTIYLQTDGYADQFGENEKGKMKKRTLIQLLTSLQQQEMPEQENELKRYLLEWQGTEAQTDDILLIGIRL